MGPNVPTRGIEPRSSEGKSPILTVRRYRSFETLNCTFHLIARNRTEKEGKKEGWLSCICVWYLLVFVWYCIHFLFFVRHKQVPVCHLPKSSFQFFYNQNLQMPGKSLIFQELYRKQCNLLNF